MERHLAGEYVSVYVPTTPNPTSGFFLMLPRSEVVELEMSVDTALKYVISMGVVAPPPPGPPACPRPDHQPEQLKRIRACELIIVDKSMHGSSTRKSPSVAGRIDVAITAA
jgi:uncharacterized membrane protein